MFFFTKYDTILSAGGEIKGREIMAFNEKVARLLKEKGMTKATLAKMTGIPYTTLDSMLKRETETAKLTTIFRIASVLDTSVEELVFDEKKEELPLSSEERRILELFSLLDSRGKETTLSLLEKEAEHSRRQRASAASHTVKPIKIYEFPAAAGEPLPVFSGESAVEEHENVPEQAEFGIRISGDSMEPVIHDGQIVYVKRQDEIASGEIGIFLLNGESLCKKLVSENGKIFLASINPRYAAIPILASDDLKFVGKVLNP